MPTVGGVHADAAAVGGAGFGVFRPSLRRAGAAYAFGVDGTVGIIDALRRNRSALRHGQFVARLVEPEATRVQLAFAPVVDRVIGTSEKEYGAAFGDYAKRLGIADGGGETRFAGGGDIADIKGAFDQGALSLGLPDYGGANACRGIHYGRQFAGGGDIARGGVGDDGQKRLAVFYERYVGLAGLAESG